jgi:Fe2+ transport system protein FeoA
MCVVEPETFWILLLDSDFQHGKPFLTTSNRLTEMQLRERLKSMGFSDGEIESLIQKARAHPM